MRPNRIKTVWTEGGAIVAGWLTTPSANIAEAMAHQGFDSLVIDAQHGLIDYQAAVGMLQAISTTETVPLARVAWNDTGAIMKMLDAGCYGIICPMVNTKQEAEAFVAACRYPPQGYRSFGPLRAAIYAGSDYHEHANDTIATIAMIETRQAVENLEEILSVAGLDAIYVGPADLSLAYGGTQLSDYTDPELIALLDHILITAQKFDVVAGIHNGTAEYAQQMIDKGFQFVTVQNEVSFMLAETQRVLSVLGRGPQEQKPSGPY